MVRTLKISLLCLALLLPYAAYTHVRGQSQSDPPPLIARDIQEKIPERSDGKLHGSCGQCII